MSQPTIPPTLFVLCLVCRDVGNIHMAEIVFFALFLLTLTSGIPPTVNSNLCHEVTTYDGMPFSDSLNGSSFSWTSTNLKEKLTESAPICSWTRPQIFNYYSFL